MILFQMAEAYYQSAGAIEWTAPEQCLKAGKIFNTVTMGCVECSESNTEPNPAMHTECECSAGNKRAFYENLTNNQLKIESKCEKCPEGSCFFSCIGKVI